MNGLINIETLMTMSLKENRKDITTNVRQKEKIMGIVK